MTNQIRRKKVDVIEWIFNRSTGRHVSDTFSFQDCQCHLEFVLPQLSVERPRQHDYNVYFKSSRLLQHPVTVTVRVFSNSNKVGTPCTTSITTENQIIWCYSERLPKGFLIIEMSIHDDRDDHSKEEKCIQTASYLNPDLSADDLNKDFSKLLPTGLYHDVELKCGEESFKAHKFVLCARSDVFKAMLESDMKERRTGVVEIKDVDARYFQDFVRYLYTDAMPELTLEEATVLYEAGDKYGIRSLMLRCSEYLRDTLSRENAFKCFKLAEVHSDQKLKDDIKTYILDEKIYLEEEHWSPFCTTYPEEAIEVYRLSHKRISEETKFSNVKKLKDH